MMTSTPGNDENSTTSAKSEEHDDFTSSAKKKTLDDFDSMTLVELKELLRKAGLPVSGKKAELVLRLSKAS